MAAPTAAACTQVGCPLFGVALKCTLLNHLFTEKQRLCGSPAAVTRRRGVGWRRWRLVSQWIILFPTMACSSINRR
ncbi:unnamed protein product [Spirodela intermedia]|uniref:Uncharacterized protein n=1 Tax=Spirodela intermedia TaxID=51605 RepID=A0A7I8JU48_SPIIN|nr:unnamed protein product [Spirodela intermedia]CAA6673710.1 unnamed protein product [Spirodela intermedia]